MNGLHTIRMNKHSNTHIHSGKHRKPTFKEEDKNAFIRSVHSGRFMSASGQSGLVEEETLLTEGKQRIED